MWLYLRANSNCCLLNKVKSLQYEWTKERVLELRIPWLLIQTMDPSQKEFIVDVYKDGDTASVFIENNGVGLVLVDEQGEAIHTLPHSEAGIVPALELYTWENWDLPLSKERLKKSYYIVQDAFESIE